MLTFDEINSLEQSVKAVSFKGKTAKEVEDTVLDYLLYAYVMGVKSAAQDLGIDIEPSARDAGLSVYAEVSSKDFAERIAEYAPGLALSGAEADEAETNIKRVIYTEAHRITNEAIVEQGVKHGATHKVWQTMLDDRVRETHEWLQSTVVPIDADFYSYTGAHGPAPGQFHDPAEDINCRCYIELIKGETK